MWKVFRNPRHRPLIIACVLASFLIIFLYGFQRFHDYEIDIERAEVSAKNTSFILEQQIESTFENVNLSLLHIVDIIKERGPNFKWNYVKYNNFLNNQLSLVPEVIAYKVIDAAGNYIGQSDSIQYTTANLSDREYFQKHKNNLQSGLIISKPIIGRTVKIPLITISRRLSGPEGSFKGITMALISLDYFNAMFSKINSGANGNISFISLAERTIISRHPSLNVELNAKVTFLPELENIIKSGSTEGVYPGVSIFDGLEKIFGVSINKKYGFLIINGLAKKDFLRNWYQNIFLTGTSVILILIGFFIGIFYFLRSIDQVELQRVKITESAKMQTLVEMAGGVAHEINNPLAIIYSKTDAIRMILETGKPDVLKIKIMLDGIEHTVTRIAKIVDGLKTFSKHIENAHMETIALSKVIENSINLVSEKMNMNNIAFRVSPVPSISILCHHAQIIQVLLSLLSNSFDAVIGHPHNRWIEMTFELSDSAIAIFITDSGRAIPVEVKEKMMNPFFTTKPIGQGAGLGLSISKGIIESHRGTLIFNSNSINTQFIVSLPIVNKTTA